MRARTLALVEAMRWAFTSDCVVRNVAAAPEPAAKNTHPPSDRGKEEVLQLTPTDQFPQESYTFRSAIPPSRNREAALQEPASVDKTSQERFRLQKATPPPRHQEAARQQLASFENMFQESYRLQSGAGVGDLESAVEGFDLLTRTRRGPAWPGHDHDCAYATAEKYSDPFCWNGGDRRTESEAGGTGGDEGVIISEAVFKDAGGDRRDGGGLFLEAFSKRADGRGDDGGGVSGVEAFLEAKEGDVREFFIRSQDNFALATEGDFQMPGLWGPDVFSALTRGSNFITALHKLDHDREQLEYLIGKRRLPQEFEQLAKEYGTVRETIATIMANGGNRTEAGIRGRYYAMGSDGYERLRGLYNSLLHVPRDYSEGPGGSRSLGPRVALNPELDWEAIEEEYLSKELPLVWFDGFLSPDALEGVLEYCREATVFFDVKIGYLGAYLNDGLSSPWLVQIARELQQRLPRVLEGMTISNIWAYKFDSDTSMDGITVHADVAKVNLNFWVTPDEANLDPSSGGLVVYPKEPPHVDAADDLAGESEMDAKLWNNFASEHFIKSWLKDEGVYDLAVTIPYRQNRVVMFDSRLLHETDSFRFRQGYEHRRINLTFLFSRA